MTYREVMPDGTVRLTGTASTGIPGPAGPAGPAGPPGSSTILFTFGVPSTTWVCVHNLGRKVDVSIFDNNSDEIGGDVFQNPDGNSVTITFFYPVAGSAAIQ